MRKYLSLSAVVVLLLGSAGGARAVEVGAAGGVTSQGDMTYRLSVGLPWDQQWWKSDLGHATGYWDAGYTYWEGGSGDDNYSGAHSLSLSPVFTYEFSGLGVTPFLEFGVGVAFFSKTRVGEKQLGSSFNFEDRIGAGLRFAGGQKIGVRAIHYSNAGIKQPNDGIESFSAYYSHAF
ncbi:lipid A 3-O-deacylase [Azotobacter beijerinckii]|uniref:Lipid A deacylase n=1 Tax=Azotobacter beijerinckii TaxID=170623 RepID=A0A1H6U3L1_9GAMM|nr:acyloxyacyl hydrolase [Azotobacter beijerinckii]SEI86076.1 lipid A 3-O-deacylase [Azotobacter beijerinckii]SEJ03727.1 lipid A 3-O-deacylase [Azotobacter beijerinckii]